MSTPTSRVLGAGIGRARPPGGSYKKWFGTVHNDGDGSVLRRLVSNIGRAHDDRILTYALVGPPEVSSDSAERVSGTGGVRNERSGFAGQEHHHLAVECADRKGPRAVRSILCDGLEGLAVGGVWLTPTAAAGTELAVGYATKDPEVYDSLPPDRKKEAYGLRRDQSVLEVGTIATFVDQGKRTDIDKFKELVSTGEIRSYPEALHLASGLCARAKGFVLDYLRESQGQPFELRSDARLRNWQRQLIDHLCGPYNDRRVMFVVDRKGSAGKTWFTQHCQLLMDRNTGEDDRRIVCDLRPGKVDNVASTLRADASIFLMDCPREATEFLQYRSLEEIKDRAVANHKYQSSILYLKENHLVVFMNELPDPTRLSQDRYVTWELSERDLEYYEPPSDNGHGPEFSSDNAGDGPSDNMTSLEEALLKEATVSTTDVATAWKGRRVLTSAEAGAQLCPASHFWDLASGMTGMGVESYEDATAARRRFHVSRAVNPRAVGIAEAKLGAPLRSIDSMVVDLTYWPTARDVWSRCFNMRSGRVVGTSYRDLNGIKYCSVDGWWYDLRLDDSKDRSPPGSDRMSFGLDHALRQQYENAAGNPRRNIVEDDFCMVRMSTGVSPNYEDALLYLPLKDWVTEYTAGSLTRVGVNINLWG